MNRIIRLFGLLAISLLLNTGCTIPATTSVPAHGFTQNNPGNVSPSAELTSGDVIELSVEVDGNMEVLSHGAQINPQGMVTLPLVGDVKIGGCTLGGARDVIAETYGAYYVNPPVVMVSLQAGLEGDGEWGSVTVMGRVAQPGRVPIRSQQGMNLTEAIQLAGGFSPSAKKSGIRISRTDKLGMKMRVSVDFNEIGEEGNTDADIKLIDGDIVYVPERIF